MKLLALLLVLSFSVVAAVQNEVLRADQIPDIVGGDGVEVTYNNYGKKPVYSLNYTGAVTINRPALVFACSCKIKTWKKPSKCAYAINTDIEASEIQKDGNIVEDVYTNTSGTIRLATTVEDDIDKFVVLLQPYYDETYSPMGNTVDDIRPQLLIDPLGDDSVYAIRFLTQEEADKSVMVDVLVFYAGSGLVPDPIGYHKISGTITRTDNVLIPTITITFNGDNGFSDYTAKSDSSGNYYVSVEDTWSGTIVASDATHLFVFTPLKIRCNNVVSDIVDKDFIGVLSPRIDGHVREPVPGGTPISGVTINFIGNTGFQNYMLTTDSAGNYFTYIEVGWSGIITASKTGYTFLPSQVNILNAEADNNYRYNFINGVDVTTHEVGVRAQKEDYSPYEGATLTIYDQNDNTVATQITDENGEASYMLPDGFNGKMGLTATDYTFNLGALFDPYYIINNLSYDVTFLIRGLEK